MKRILRRRIIIKQDEVTFIHKNSGANTASSHEKAFDTCPTCGTSFLLATALQSSVAAEVEAYSATELPQVLSGHECEQTEEGANKRFNGKQENAL